MQSLASTRDVALLQELGGGPGIASKLGTDLSRGLNAQQVESMRKCFGRNVLPPKKRTMWLEFFWDSITDLTLLILSAGAIISIAFGLVTNHPQDSITVGDIMLAGLEKEGQAFVSMASPCKRKSLPSSFLVPHSPLPLFPSCPCREVPS